MPLDPIELEIKKAVVEIMTAAAESARQTVPVRTGELQESIRVEVETQGATIDVTLLAGGDPDLDGVDANYAMDIEVRSPFLAPTMGTIESKLRTIANG